MSGQVSKSCVPPGQSQQSNSLLCAPQGWYKASQWADSNIILYSFVSETPLALLVVGLGGGSLPLFVHDHFPKSCIDAVEIDPSMLEVATQWFGFSQSNRMKVHIADGLDYITSLAGREGNVLVNLEGCWGKINPRLSGLQEPLEFISKKVASKSCQSFTCSSVHSFVDLFI